MAEPIRRKRTLRPELPPEGDAGSNGVPEPVKPKRRRRTGPLPTSTPGFIPGHNRTNEEV